MKEITSLSNIKQRKDWAHGMVYRSWAHGMVYRSWANGMVDRSLAFWMTLIFSDESLFSKLSDSSRVSV